MVFAKRLSQKVSVSSRLLGSFLLKCFEQKTKNTLNQNKFFNFALVLLVGIAIFAVNLVYLGNFTSKSALQTETPKVVFTATSGKTTEENQAKGKGIFQIGEFTFFQLADETSEMKLKTIKFDAATKTVEEASADVNSGSVLAVNLLFGPKIELSDKNVSATNRGGSFILESKNNESKIEVLSGSVKVVVTSPIDSKKFTTVLSADQAVILNQTSLVSLFESSDPLQQTLSWHNLIQESDKKYEGENILISKIINQIYSAGEEKSLLKNNLGKYLLFSQSAKNNFYLSEIKNALNQTINGETTALASYFAAHTENKAALQTTAKIATAYTRIFLPRNLSPKMKRDVMRLAESFPQLAQFTAIADLDTETTLMRNLAFVDTDPANEEYAKAFWQQIRSDETVDNSELSAQLLTLISNNKKIINKQWLDNFYQLNSTLVGTKTGLSTAIMNQLKLADTLINSNQGNLGSNALQGLADLLAKGKGKFDADLLAKISMQGNDLKNRIAFLASSHSAASDTFDEASYEKWLEDQNLEVTVEDTPIETAQVEVVMVEDPKPSENELTVVVDEPTVITPAKKIPRK